MKRLFVLILMLSLLFAGCGVKGAQQGESSSQAESQPFREVVWEDVRRQLPENLYEPEVVETVALVDPHAREAATFLSGALIAYPEHPVALGPDNPPTMLFLLHTGLLNSDGTQFGQTGTEGRIFRQVHELLDYPSGFLGKEQVEAGVRRYFPESALDHQSVPLTDSGAAFVYRADLGLYLYPQEEAKWYLPVLLSYGEDADGNCWTQIAFVRSATEAGEAYYGCDDKLMGAWEVEDIILENPQDYPRYQVELKRDEKGLSLVSVTPVILEEDLTE